MDKAQGSLEYLIVVAAVLGITAVVVAFVSGVFIEHKKGASITKCKDAAARCSQDIATSQGTPSCDYCVTSCRGINLNASGANISKNATALCREGKVGLIHEY